MDMANLAQTLLGLSIVNFAELLVFGSFLTLLQWWLPARRDQKSWDGGSWLDIIYSFLLTVSTPFFIAVPIALVSQLQSFAGVSSWSESIATELPFHLQVIMAIVVVDVVGYWRHRLMHTKWLWPIHAIHHSSTRLNWLSTERFHIFNHVITATINIIIVQLLFGQAVTAYSTIARRFYNLFIHANIRLDYGWMGYLLVSPRFHHWHHAEEEEARDKNYSTFLSLTDLLFGTFYLPRDGRYPERLGEPDHMQESLLAHFTYPFTAWNRMRVERQNA